MSDCRACQKHIQFTVLQRPYQLNTAMKDVSAHNRVAIGYLRTENIDLATLEIDRMRNAWVTFTERFAGKLAGHIRGKSALRQSNSPS